MAKAVSMVRQTTSQASTFVGQIAQLIVDTGLWTIRVHDAATPGGFALLSGRNNLSDLADVVTARNNLDLGTAALSDVADFDAAGSADALVASITAAQATATTGVTNAAAAQTTANTAVTNAAAAQTAANTGVANAATAQTTANAAQTTANTGVTNAAAAQATANTAVANAATAQTQANLGVTNAAAAQATANAAAVKANNLSDLANVTTARQNLGFKSVISADLAITAGGALTYNHAIGQQPSGVRYCLVCQSAEGFYSAGDVIDVMPGNTTTGVANRGFASRITTTNVFIQFGSASGGNVFAYTNNLGGDGFVLTNANWKLRIYVTYIPAT
jgi:hypothetical protein